MTAVRIGVVLSAVVVALGTVWSVAGYLSNRGTDVAGLFAAGAIFFGGIALALIWLAVFVVVVIQKGIRVLGGSQ
jgi:hypothetical protein